MKKAELSAPFYQRMVRHIAQREMALPLLCLVAGHRPLAFVAGQILYLLEPLAAIGGQSRWQMWAALLSDPAGYDLLTETLARSTETSSFQTSSIQTNVQPTHYSPDYGLE